MMSKTASHEIFNSQEAGELVLNYPLFDGEKVIENASVVIKDGVISSIGEAKRADCGELFMIPGLIDAHTHINTAAQTQAMLKHGVSAACDISAPASLVSRSEFFTFVSSAGMTMGTLNGVSYVKQAISCGAKYIKVMLTEPVFMPKSVIRDICDTAHENGLKVAVHAVSLKAVRAAVSCGADILIHVPMKEEFPRELAETISEKGISVVPTLVMMKAFADSGRGSYKAHHYENAENAVRLLRECGVPILVGTDANDGSFSPPVEYGRSLHREAKLLSDVGLTPCEILAGASVKTAKAFDISDFGKIAVGKRAVLLLCDGRPDKNISDAKNIRQIIVDGKAVL